MIAEALRGTRTAALWLAGPLDWLWRRARGGGRAGLPPLWLRRHAGPVRSFESSAEGMERFLDGLGLLAEPGTILDVGCGSGSMVPILARRLGAGGRYVGFDVHAPSIRWCRRRYAEDPRLRFELARVASPYGTRAGGPAAAYRFPIEDGEADLVLAKSVFTHLLPDDASGYLREIRRCLRPGRPAVVTAFLFDPAPGRGREDAGRAFPFTGADGSVRWRLRLRPAAAVAYARPRFEELVEGAGLRVQWLSPGFYPGQRRLVGQDTLLLGL